MDKEYAILNAVNDSPYVSQRELAKKTALSLGSINIILKKMIREGLLKVEKIPSDRVAYILTRRGIEEKLMKTRSYIQGHYSALEQMRGQLNDVISINHLEGKCVRLEVGQQELKQLLTQVLNDRGVAIVTSETGSEYDCVLSDTESMVTTQVRWVDVLEYIKL